MKRRRIPSCRLRNCCVPISNVLKRVRTTDGSESGYVNTFMPAEDLVKELLFGVGTKEDMAETERNILEHQVDAEDVIVISEDEMEMDIEERAYSSFSSTDDFQEDRTWRKAEKSQPRMPPRTVKKRAAVILPSNWQSRSRDDVQQSLQSQDGRLRNVLDDVHEDDDLLPAEQRVPSLPSLPPSSVAENSRVHLPNDWQNMTLNTFKDTTSFNNNNVNGISRILENIDVEEEVGYTEVSEEYEMRLTRNENDVESSKGKRKKKKKSKYKDSQRIHTQFKRRKEMKKSKKQKKVKRKEDKRIVLPTGWQKKTREELYTEILSGNPVPAPVSQDHSQDGGQECSSPVRKEFLPLINESPDLSLIE